MAKKKRRTLDDILDIPEEKRGEILKQYERVLSLSASAAIKRGAPWSYYDYDSIELLDEKEDIFTRIENGEDVPDKEVFSVFEDFPKGNIWWD